METHLDLFSGIGGFSYAFESTGRIKTVGFSEIDPYASLILKKHWPDVPNYGDIRTITKGVIDGKIDIITGGFPCQPFSLAGKRRGEDDDRHLWPQMLRVISEFQPRWVVGENVTGIVKMALDQCITDLEDQNYEVQCYLIPACGVDAPHKRERCWIIGRYVADTDRNGTGGDQSENGPGSGFVQDGETRRGATDVADPDSRRGGGDSPRGSCRPVACYANVQDLCEGQPEPPPADAQQGDHYMGGRGALWPAEPQVGRVADGFPGRVDQIKCLGNSIVPAVAQEIAWAILEEEGAIADSVET